MLSHFLKVVLLTWNVAFRSRHGAPLTMGLMESNWAELCHLQTQPARAFSVREWNEPWLGQGVCLWSCFSWQLSTCMKQDVNGVHSLAEALLPGAASAARGSCPRVMLNSIAWRKLKAVSFTKILLFSMEGKWAGPWEPLSGSDSAWLGLFWATNEAFLLLWGRGRHVENSPGSAQSSLPITVTHG